MLKKLDLDNNISRWLPAYEKVMAGENAVCPVCGNVRTEPLVMDLGDGIGFVTITCPKCGKTGYFSRVKIPGNEH